MSKKDKEPEIEIPEGATPEEIADIYLAEEEEESDVAYATDHLPDDIDDAGTPSETEPPSETSTPGIETILAQADPMKGDKDPIVIEWCRNNLSREEFDARYAGRKI